EFVQLTTLCNSGIGQPLIGFPNRTVTPQANLCRGYQVVVGANDAGPPAQPGTACLRRGSRIAHLIESNAMHGRWGVGTRLHCLPALAVARTVYDTRGRSSARLPH